MEYIRQQLDRKITFLTAAGKEPDLKIYQQARLEYVLMYTLGYLWNKNLNMLDGDEKEYVFNKVFRPSIGDIIDISKRLDIEKQIFGDKKVLNGVEKYPKFRNEKIGHGYTFEDGNTDFIKTIEEIYRGITASKSEIFSNEVDLVVVHRLNGEVYQGVRFMPDGANYLPWSCPKQTHEFQIGGLYGCLKNYTYFRLSPFIEIKDENEFYVFCSVQERLIGLVKYNQIFKSNQFYKEWSEFCNFSIEADNLRRVTSNKTIINIYKNNYKKYIPIDAKKKVLKFLKDDKSSVCATVWGHGGVGKTATIQSVCEDLSNNEYKYFDYIIFLTAKDRFYNYYTGSISELTEKVDSLEAIVQNVNNILFGSPSNEISGIVNYQGKLLLIIDDFETFQTEEKEKIGAFIRLLNINHHKVVITTRADVRIGEEFQTNELSEQETFKFLLEVINIELPELNLPQLEKELTENDNYKIVYQITSGRPLFIFQFALIYGAKRSIKEALATDILHSKYAIEFLYGRIYDYLSRNAQNLFVIISQLVTKNDLSNLLDKAKFILNLEHQENVFKNAVNELVRLRIIENKENNFFQVYSVEILQIMSDYFEKRDRDFKLECGDRLTIVGKDIKLDNEQALLVNANSGRLSKDEEDVVLSYRNIISRSTSPEEIKLQAILNLAAYLFNDRGKKEQTIKLFEDYLHIYNENGSFIKMYAVYSWATIEQRQKAVSILLDYLAKTVGHKNDINLELLGLLTTCRSILTISQRDELKGRLLYKEISNSEFDNLKRKQTETFNNIFRQQGVTLFSLVKNIDLENFSPGARANAITGLYQFVEVCIRLQKFDVAEDVCVHAFGNFPLNFHAQFKAKLSKIYRFQRSGNDVEKMYKWAAKTIVYSTANKNKGISEFGEIIKDLFNNQ